ncbi:MAG: sodium:solute symporter [Bacteroidetes bacterium]|nr:sodium:solute symporter [Bacteroidota bacterium]MDA1120086.1 sodium:solute symporter [Bacteroidota bacterium]
MSNIDLIVLFGTLILIAIVGIWQSWKQANLESYFLGGKSLKWGTIGLSVMATQASAITFISTPGQAYESGMAFVQNYLGLPIALVVVCVFFIPIYYRLNVYTAYEYLENRFDLKTRLFGAFLFLVQRGLAAGITILAPSIIVSSILGWDLSLTILMVGVLVIIYTVSGGTKAVSITQKYQMLVILFGMVVAFFVIINKLPTRVSFGDAVTMAGLAGKLDVIDFSFDFEKRYTFWSGILGGFFLSLSYFGTDQSQVQRYISGKDTTESRMGLMFNAILKVPMQFFILFTGVMVFMFYQFNQAPIHFNKTNLDFLATTEYAEQGATYEQWSDKYHKARMKGYELIDLGIRREDTISIHDGKAQVLGATIQIEEARKQMKSLITKADPDRKTKDSDYVFLTFIMNEMPVGLIGLLIAVIFAAAMSSTAGELNALASTSTIDYYKRLIKPNASEKHYLIASKVQTLGWGILAITFALFATSAENLIEGINILGSLFYGTILGLFLVGFFMKRISGTAVFIGALVAQITVLGCHFATISGYLQIGYLWYNAIGLLIVVIVGWLVQLVTGKK